MCGSIPYVVFLPQYKVYFMLLEFFFPLYDNTLSNAVLFLDIKNIDNPSVQLFQVLLYKKSKFLIKFYHNFTGIFSKSAS